MTSPEPHPEWTAVEITSARDTADAICNFCHERETQGLRIEEIDSDLTRITAYFSREIGDTIVQEIRDYLDRLNEIFPDFPRPTIASGPIENEDWAVMWKEHFKPLHIGTQLIVTPPWIEPDSADKHLIIIDPAAAFGTGSHETTQGCLELLELAAGELTGAGSRGFSFFDVGCGSGILSIAAARLGAGYILGIDNDPVAVDSARSNARLNGLEKRIEWKCAPLRNIDFKAEALTANLDPMTLKENRDLLIGAFTRFLIVSGVPLDQWDEIREIFVSDRTRLVKERSGSEWGCGLFQTTTDPV